MNLETYMKKLSDNERARITESLDNFRWIIDSIETVINEGNRIPYPYLDMLRDKANVIYEEGHNSEYLTDIIEGWKDEGE